MAATKKRVIKSLENLSDNLRDLLHEQYPNGYESSITRITNAKNEPMFVFPLETEDSVYLVKVPATKNSDGGYDVESGKRQEFEGGEESDDFSGGSDDFEGDNYDGGDDDERSSSNSREASYDPDFDS
ncbi:MAG TPA: hypothetical protein DGG95_12400 [Cytophagales bacterium]|jgi:hypothetical protein|nr:hypothetical protein [Cytophagales bacterium]